jgi:glycosyltransferase involved in cell wall biosynthesis
VNLLLCLHHELDPNAGAPGATLALGNELERLGHSVSYLSHDDLPRRLPAPATELLFPELAALRLRRAAGLGVDVIDAATGDAWVWARFLRRRRARAPALVTRSHGLEQRFWQEQLAEARLDRRRLPLRTRLYHGGWRLREVAASLRLADACVFLNQDDRRFAIEHLGVDGERAHVVANGVPSAFLERPVGAEPARGDVGIAHIGSWAERKGSRYLASALGAVLARHEQARATLVGTRCPAEVVTAEFPAEVRSRVSVVPGYEHPELPALLDGHQIVVSAALAEGFSLALPEAMACGLAPVATAVGAAGELITPGADGVLVPARDAGAIEAAVSELVGSPNRLAALRAAARTTAERYSWEAVARDTLAVYEAAGTYAEGRSASAIS